VYTIYFEGMKHGTMASHHC